MSSLSRLIAFQICVDIFEGVTLYIAFILKIGSRVFWFPYAPVWFHFRQATWRRATQFLVLSHSLDSHVFFIPILFTPCSCSGDWFLSPRINCQYPEQNPKRSLAEFLFADDVVYNWQVRPERQTKAWLTTNWHVFKMYSSEARHLYSYEDYSEKFNCPSMWRYFTAWIDVCCFLFMIPVQNWDRLFQTPVGEQ